jgi:hypothetical protein
MNATKEGVPGLLLRRENIAALIRLRFTGHGIAAGLGGERLLPRGGLDRSALGI